MINIIQTFILSIAYLKVDVKYQSKNDFLNLCYQNNILCLKPVNEIKRRTKKVCGMLGA